jgi:hypothetical protein
MELRDTERKWKPWKRLKRTVLQSNTDEAIRLNPTLSTAPTLTEPANQTAESPLISVTGILRVGDLALVLLQNNQLTFYMDCTLE